VVIPLDFVYLRVVCKPVSKCVHPEQHLDRLMNSTFEINRDSRSGMAKVTLIFAVLLITLGVAGFVGTGSAHPTALIPAAVGLLLGIFGYLAISPNEHRRKLFMHVNVTIGLVGFLGTIYTLVLSYYSTKPVDEIAADAKLTMAMLLFFYIVFCVRSFIAARRSGKV
jgi:hypothetical protein